MKKLFVLSLVALFTLGIYADARTKYDETGRYIVHDGTIRGHKRAAAQRAAEKRKLQQHEHAAAAKIDYNQNADESTKIKTRTGRVQPLTTTVYDRNKIK